MTKNEWIKEKKVEFANDPRMKTLEELGLRDRLEYDEDRKKINSLNSGYFVRSKEGDVVDVSEASMATGYIYVTWEDGELEKRLNKGGRLATGSKTWNTEDM